MAASLPGSVGTTLVGEAVRLDWRRALWWPARQTLIVADVHLGKESVFGHNGLALPLGPTVTDLDRLAELCRDYAAKRLLVLGDFVHAAPRSGADWPARISGWLDSLPGVSVSIVAGNHDRPDGRLALDPRIDWIVDDLSEPPFLFRHEPADRTDRYVLSGHLHPTLRFGTSRRHRMRAPVFWFAQDAGVLPAFGSFTGGYNIRPADTDRIFLCGPDAVLEWRGTSAVT